jgi:PBP1b-binding outer membrane lipoprotein LpoB
MNKIIGLIMVVMIAFFLLGCTTPTENTPADTTIDSVDAANNTIDDVSTDISGLNESLSEIDNILGDDGV